MWSLSIKMNLKAFRLLEKTPIDKSAVKRYFLKVNHQQGAQLSDPNQNIEFNFGEINKDHQSGKSYLDFGISVRHPTAAFNNSGDM